MARFNWMLNALLCLYDLDEHGTQTCAKYNIRKDTLIFLVTSCAPQFLCIFALMTT